MELLLSLFGGILFLFGIVLFQRKQINSDKAVINTIPFNNDLNSISKVVANAEGLLDAEKTKQQEISNNLQQEEKKDVSNEELVNFFNDQLKPGK